ncbi:hypothetical protein ACVWWR_008106 [Bradyrhizobium sp. LM3.2]
MPTQSTFASEASISARMFSGKIGRPGPLFDVTVGGDRHHDDVAFVVRGLDVPDVAEMHEVEDAVAECDLPALRLCRSRDLAEFLDCLDLFVRRQLGGWRGIVGRKIAHVITQSAGRSQSAGPELIDSRQRYPANLFTSLPSAACRTRRRCRHRDT